MSQPMHTRREFLKRGLIFLAAGSSAPFFLTRTVWGLEQQLARTRVTSVPGVPDERVLVVVQLGGGNDGLNTVVPHGLDGYYRARPTLAVAADATLKLNDQIGLHPSLAKLRGLYDEGQVAIIQGVGYPNPDRSHFRSMEIWHTADPVSEKVSQGWLGRYLDNTCPGCDPARGRTNPTGGVNLGGDLPLALRSERGLSIALGDPDTFRWTPIAGDARDARQSETTFERLNRVVANNLRDPQVARLDFLSRVAMNANLSSDRVRDALQQTRDGGNYPNSGLGRQLQMVARLIAGGLRTRVYYVSLGGFDTHANQGGQHDNLLTQFSEAIEAFYRDLRSRGDQQRVAVLSFSEFGRRVAENGSAGTDHGAGAPMFVMGPGIKGGVYGEHPGLEAGKLLRGDLAFHTDFRQVYATLLENWLGAEAAPILGGSFAKLGFV